MKSKGLGLGSILTIIFVIAKLLGLFTYGWVWVFAPIWIPMALLIAIPVAVWIISILAMLILAIFSRK